MLSFLKRCMTETAGMNSLWWQYLFFLRFPIFSFFAFARTSCVGHWSYTVEKARCHVTGGDVKKQVREE